MSSESEHPNPSTKQSSAVRVGVQVSSTEEDDELEDDESEGIGMLSLIAELPLDQAMLVWDALDSRARLLHERGDKRTMDQLRADALVDCFFDRAPARDETLDRTSYPGDRSIVKQTS
jgi:hypothetical protein